MICFKIKNPTTSPTFVFSVFVCKCEEKNGVMKGYAVQKSKNYYGANNTFFMTFPIIIHYSLSW
jgi:hypothetical protein